MKPSENILLVVMLTLVHITKNSLGNYLLLSKDGFCLLFLLTFEGLESISIVYNLYINYLNTFLHYLLYLNTFIKRLLLQAYCF